MNRKTLFKCKSGSHLYGLNTPDSDEDYVSIFMPTSHDLLSLQKCEMIDNSKVVKGENGRNTAEAIDDTSYSLPRYLHLTLQCNPNLTELLFAPKEVILETSDIYKELRSNRHLILSKRAYDSFMGFAISQRKKLEYKRVRFTELCSAIDYLEKECNTLLQDQTANNMTEDVASYLNKTVKNYKGSKHTTESFHKGLPTKIIYDKMIHERDNYGWRLHTDSFKTLGYDTKFASHTIRLLVECEMLLRDKKLTFPIPEKEHYDIMQVKTGQVQIEDFYTMCTLYEDRCRNALEKTTLPEQPEWKRMNDWLVKKLMQEIYDEYCEC